VATDLQHPAEAASAPSALDRARAKAYRRIIPLVFIAYAIAYIDRTNVSLAKLQMKTTFGWGEDIFGKAAGLFFVGYFLLEIPGALIVERWSARKWVSRIMVSWGVIAALQSLIATPGQFYTGRFVLGLAEAGFFPGIVVYLTHWFPSRDRARALALVIIAAPVAQMVSPLLSYRLLRIGTTETIAGKLVHFPQVMGLDGWQWVYIAWGIPAVVLGVLILFVMTDRPRDARWLTPEEKAALEGELARERAIDVQSRVSHLGGLKRALTDVRVWLLALINLSIVCGHYGVEIFLPTMLKNWYGLELGSLTWLVPLPYVAMLLGQVGVGISSDRSGERWWHTAVPMFVGAAALLATPFTRPVLALSLLGFAIAMGGVRSYLPPFFALPRLFLGGTAAAGGIGFINAVGNLGGFLGPSAMGTIEKMTGSFHGGIYFLAGTALLAGLLVVILRAIHQRDQHRAALPQEVRQARPFA
jgi:ACS family tartrate transporter-like MFS transporter